MIETQETILDIEAYNKRQAEVAELLKNHEPANRIEIAMLAWEAGKHWANRHPLTNPNGYPSVRPLSARI